MSQEQELKSLEEKIEGSLLDPLWDELKSYRKEGGSIDINKIVFKVKVTLSEEVGE